jgi:hypothetical protein
MKALVVYESASSNTRMIAAMVSKGMEELGQVERAEVSTAPASIPSDLNLLIVGTAGGDSQKALMKWLDTVRVPLGCSAAAFDTRVKKPLLGDTASRTVEKRLSQIGLRITAPAEGFMVDAGTGGLVAGESVRAVRWGATVGAPFKNR